MAPLRAPLLAAARAGRPPRRQGATGGPLALVGSGAHVDRLAARLLRDGGDRRALAPLARADARLLQPACGLVACGVGVVECRRLANAHRPWVASLPVGGDRYVYGTLPRLGALNAVPAAADGLPDADAVLARLVAVLPDDVACALAARLPTLRPFLVPHRRRRLAALAAGAALLRPSALGVVAGAAVARLVAGDERLRGAGSDEASAAIGVGAGAGLLAAVAAGRLEGGPRRLGGALVAVAAIAGAGRATQPSGGSAGDPGVAE